MKLELLLLLCFSGVVLITRSALQPPHKQCLMSQTLTWPAAQNYCRLKYTDLATAKDGSALLNLTELAANSSRTAPIWIGLYNDINSWRWSLYDILLDSQNIVNWNLGQPDNLKGGEACGGILSTGYWADYNCSTLKPFICFKKRKNPHFSPFVGVNIPLTWTEAVTYCRNFYIDLAFALNKMDNDQLAAVASTQGPSWFGLYRDTWMWLNGTVATNIQWSPGQPDNLNLQENCGMLQNGLLNDENCDYAHFFFCDYIPRVRRQTIKLLLKSDCSLFDLAVQSSILELIKQKLKQHGMLQDIKVTWSVQPDRNRIKARTPVPVDQVCSVESRRIQ